MVLFDIPRIDMAWLGEPIFLNHSIKTGTAQFKPFSGFWDISIGEVERSLQ